MPLIHTDWIDWADQSANWLYLPGGNEPRGIADEDWMAECIQTGSRRLGDYLIQETLGGPWGSGAMACAISHAINGDQDNILWTDVCPPTVEGGVADLVTIGNSSVVYLFSDQPDPFPAGADSAHAKVTCVAYGIWLIPVKLNLPPRGVLPIPDPEADGLTPEEAATADIEFESDVVSLVSVEIADGHNEFSADPDSRYAVNYNRQPDFSGGEWGPWRTGALPGDPRTSVPGWVDGPEDYAVTFPSEPAAFEDKTWYPLDIPADGFDSLTQDYLNDAYDYGVAAGPAEAFGDRGLTASRTASTSIILKVYVRSPRYRWVYEGTATAPPRRILGRPHPARIFGDNTVQNGRRALGGIL